MSALSNLVASVSAIRLGWKKTMEKKEMGVVEKTSHREKAKIKSTLSFSLPALLVFVVLAEWYVVGRPDMDRSQRLENGLILSYPAIPGGDQNLPRKEAEK